MSSNEMPCARLRTKNAYGDVITEHGDWVAKPESNDCYWCLSTMDVCGPDGRLVTLGACGVGRSCYVASEDESSIA
jgi:hypothetical protein